MASIILTSSTPSLELRGRAFAVVAPGYATPCGVDVVELEALRADPRRWLGGDYRTMVVVGMSKLLTPSNRVKSGQVLLRPWSGVRRIVIDRHLFVSEPWRMWWLFFSVGAERWGFTDSFLAETRWRFALEKRTEDPFSVGRVLDAMRDVVDVRDDAFRFAPIEVETVLVNEEQRAAYTRAKEEAFAHEKTIAAILKRLAAFAQECVPERSIPSASRLFARPPERIVRTDLGVDSFLVGQLLERVTLTNAIAGAAP